MKKLIVLTMFVLIGLMACQSKSELIEAENVEETEEKNPEDITEPEAELPPMIIRRDIDLTETEKQINRQNQSFAFNLLKNVSKGEDSNKNIFLSPLSASLALAMLDNGSAGDTHKEIQEGLGFGGFSREEQNFYLQKIVIAMSELDPRGVFESGNSIWIRENFHVLDNFKNINIQYYNAEIRNEDFFNPKTVDLINGWVDKKTHGKISNVLDNIPSNTVMYLINTLYFKGLWSEPFIKEMTKTESFFNQDGTTVNLPTMNMTSFYLSNYVKKEQYSMLELPFGNRAFSTVFILPDMDVSVKSIVDKMDENWWEQCLVDLQKSEVKEVNIKLPRFKIEYERVLNEDFKLMGMKSMFSNADLSLINPNAGLFVSDVMQKTFAEVKEEGMEAAAATSIMVTASMPPEYPKVDFHVNRPFILLVKEKSTGTVFFTGIIRNL